MTDNEILGKCKEDPTTALQDMVQFSREVCDLSAKLRSIVIEKTRRIYGDIEEHHLDRPEEVSCADSDIARGNEALADIQTNLNIIRSLVEKL